MVRTRFAPSPTGFLHVGGLRTALYAYAWAKKNKGAFILRIEDTDRERYVEGAVENLQRTLAWAGLQPDEGPYVQSERLDLYKKHAEILLAKGAAYYCFCKPERLEELRSQQQAYKQPLMYDRHCLTNNQADAAQRVAAGESHVVRLKMPREGESTFADLVRGTVSIKNELVDDQVLLKADGFPTYHLAVVVDDHDMRITHVIRGEEWISSTPKHLQLYKYFGWEAPQFAHLSLILNPDKSKLSKRQGDVAAEDFKNKGYLPEALINFIAFLGWNPGDERELFTLPELVAAFDFEHVSKAGAVFNLEKLNWYNKEYIKKLSNEELAKRALPWFEEANIKTNIESVSKIIGLEKERVATLAELPKALSFVFAVPAYAKELLVWRKGSIEEVQKILPELAVHLQTIADWTKPSIEASVMSWIQEKGYTTGSVLWPFRVAVSGQQNSPGPFEIAEVLGKNESLERLQQAIQKAQK